MNITTVLSLVTFVPSVTATIYLPVYLLALIRLVLYSMFLGVIQVIFAFYQ
ncbi:MAG: hypothetical protein IPJ60_11990 [Sphingobacteriaceae bacterium]|nr:hypothetical protein [Sphingobacteriaceae bacterium]